MVDTATLTAICRGLRYDILTSTTEAGSGHPSSSLSAVELIATLFFAGFFMQDSTNLHSPLNDRIIFSKGHAAPLLYALYRMAGLLSHEELLTLRKTTSNLEGHPTPRLPFVDVATGSLGQGLSIGLGMSIAARKQHKDKTARIEREPKVFVLMGDSELAEGQNWEAIELASYYRASNLIGILDVNRLGQRGETMLGWDLQQYATRFQAFGWNTVVVNDGHDIQKLQKAYSDVVAYSTDSNHSPSVIIAKTIKGKGVSLLEDADNWHGKTLNQAQLETALAEIGEIDIHLTVPLSRPSLSPVATSPEEREQPANLQEVISRLRYNYGEAAKSGKQTNLTSSRQSEENTTTVNLKYTVGQTYSTRQAYGDALVALAPRFPNLMVLNAETSNSTMEQSFAKQFPEQFLEMFIAEQNMVSVAVGLDRCGYTAVVSSFGAFLTRAFDQMRMAQYSDADIKIVGSHVGVSIGADGSSQMALEDISMIKSILKSIILYPSDATSTVKLVEQMLNNQSLTYLRLTREKTPVLYPTTTEFPIGGSHILKESSKDLAVIFSAGYTLHEALKAYEILEKQGIHVAVVDLYSIKPLDEKTILKFATISPYIVIVEDHYVYGGIGDYIFALLATHEDRPSSLPLITHLAVKEIPHSGKTEDVVKHNGLDAQSIVNAVLTKRVHKSTL